MFKKYFHSILLAQLGMSILLTVSVHAQDNKIISEKEDHCVSCHKENDMLPGDFSENDVHRHADLSCAGCHGGDPSSSDETVAMSKAKGFVGIPAKKDIPQFCGKCHSNINVMRVFQPRIATDQVAQYYTSLHGKKLLSGDQNVAECTSCHTAHNILPAKDPRSTVYALNVPATCNKCHGNKELMDKYGLSNNPMEEYAKSVHGNALLVKKDIGAPACNDCHGNHGAMPPGLTSISHVCGTCHINNMEYFKNTRMAQAFDEMDFHGCEQCHGNHDIRKTDDSMVGVGENSTCINCHNSGDEGYTAAVRMSSDLTNLKKLYDSTKTLLGEVRQKGMNDVEIGFLLQDVNQSLIQSRTLIHTFDTSRVNQKSSEGIVAADKALVMADTQINEYYTRRNGFAAATLVFLLLIVALYFKIKDIERRKK